MGISPGACWLYVIVFQAALYSPRQSGALRRKSGLQSRPLYNYSGFLELLIIFYLLREFVFVDSKPAFPTICFNVLWFIIFANFVRSLGFCVHCYETLDVLSLLDVFLSVNPSKGSFIFCIRLLFCSFITCINWCSLRKVRSWTNAFQLFLMEFTVGTHIQFPSFFALGAVVGCSKKRYLLLLSSQFGSGNRLRVV